MKAARIIQPNESLQIQQLETPKPKGSQVLVKVNSSGVCHSDIHLWQGGYEGPGGQLQTTTDRTAGYVSLGLDQSYLKAIYKYHLRLNIVRQRKI